MPLLDCRMRIAVALAAGLLLSPLVAAQTPPAGNETGPEIGMETEEAVPPVPEDPYDAYAAGLYDRALQGFVDQQVERPEDPALHLNIGSAHYRMKDYEAARQAFARAAMAGDEALRAEALYNLGNTAYREGKLEEAIRYYQSALDIDSEDEDAKFNLEFVRDEIRRRHEEQQKRQNEQQQQQQQQQQQGEQQQEGEQQQGEQQQEGEPQQQPGAAPEDRDGDGLPDEVERQGANPTDPENPDTDEDGLRDGEEDLNRNGQLDEGETDPNRADTDGDGRSDAEERRAESQPQPSEAEGMEAREEGLSQEEAERYLQALEEGRPEQKPARAGRQRRVEKDW